MPPTFAAVQITLLYDGSGRPWQQQALAQWCQNLPKGPTHWQWRVAGLPAAAGLGIPQLAQLPRSWWARWRYQQRLEQQLLAHPPQVVLKMGQALVPAGWKGPVARLYHPDWCTCGPLRTTTGAVLAGYHWQWPAAQASHGATMGTAALPGTAQASWQQKEQTKRTYSNDSEYWLAIPGTEPDDALQLLKAFSQLKKRQQTSMRLLVLFEADAPAAWLQKLSSYKFRHDVQVHERAPLTLLQALLPAAYALLLHSQAAYGWLMASAMAAGTPIAVPDTPTATELLSGACYRLQQWSEEPLAAAMSLLYRDEHYRNTLIHTSSTLAAAMPLARQQHALYQWLQQFTTS